MYKLFYLPIILIPLLFLAGCGVNSNEYFLCTASAGIDDTKESLVINQAKKSLTFKSMDTRYKEPRPNYILSQYKLTEESKETHILKFDIVTGELTWSVNKGRRHFAGKTIINTFKYECRKVEKILK